MFDGEIIRREVLSAAREAPVDTAELGARFALKLIWPLLLVLAGFIYAAHELKLRSRFGIPVQLELTACPVAAASTLHCYALHSRGRLLQEPGDKIELQLFKANNRGHTPSLRVIVLKKGDALIVTAENGSPVVPASIPLVHASLVLGYRQTSPIDVLLDSWRKLVSKGGLVPAILD